MSALEQIYTKLQAIDGKLDELVEWKGGLDERCLNRGKEIKTIQHILFGNPDDGLASKVQTLLNCKKGIKTRQVFFQGILRSLIVAGILALAAWLLYVYKILPAPG